MNRPESISDPDPGVDGVFEAILDGRAVGWAHDRSAANRKVELELSVDGQPLGRTVADLFRPSLVKAGIGDGRHAFAVDIPLALCDGAEHTVSIRLPSGRSLRVGRPFVVTANHTTEWSRTRFTVDGEPLVSGAGPEPRAPRASPLSVNGPGGSAARIGSRELRLSACDETYFLRHTRDEGFSLKDIPETIFLGDGPITVQCPDPVLFEIQPGVLSPRLEREKRVSRKRTYTARRPSVCRLPGGIVDTECFLTCPDEGRYLIDSLRGHRITEWFGYSVLPDWTQVREVSTIVERDERVVVLGAQNNTNYSHWLLESVARAALFQALDDGTRQFLTPPLEDWQRRTLEFAGVSPDRIMELEPSGIVRFAEVVAVTRAMGRVQELNPAVLEVLAALTPSVSRRRRLYISRAHANVRRVSNEPALIELFESHGFDVIHPQMLPIEEQAELFAGAEVVAGAHGSGNSGIIFSAPGTLMIELQSEGFDKGGIEYLWNLCAARGHRFAQILCAHVEGAEHVPTTHRDITVDLPHLAARLSTLLSDSRTRHGPARQACEHRYDGRLEMIADGLVLGWAIDWSDPSERVSLQVLLDGELVGVTIADLPRPTLAKAGIGDGTHGFALQLPGHMRERVTDAVSVLTPDGMQLTVLDAFRVSISGPAQSSHHVAGVATRALRLWPVSQAMLSRRSRREGFGSTGRDETIVLDERTSVCRDHGFEVAVQPGVLDDAGERSQRERLPDQYLAGPVLASRLCDGLVDTRSFLTCPEEGQYLLDSVRFLGALPRSGFALCDDGLLEYDCGSIPRHDEKVVVLGAQSSHNYYHWLLESLARVLLYRPLDDGSTRYLTPPLTEWQRETLRLVGVTPERVLEMKPLGLARFREVISVSRGVGLIHEPIPAAVAALADLARPVSARRRIYVSRKGAAGRRIGNESEVAELLARHGFQAVSCESLSVGEQIALFAGAEAVLGVHGAGLANILFSPPGTRVIELCPEGTVWTGNAIYRTLAAVRGQPLLQVVCRADPNAATQPATVRDMVVDVGHLEAFLERSLPVADT